MQPNCVQAVEGWEDIKSHLEHLVPFLVQAEQTPETMTYEIKVQTNTATDWEVKCNLDNVYYECIWWKYTVLTWSGRIIRAIDNSMMLDDGISVDSFSFILHMHKQKWKQKAR